MYSAYPASSATTYLTLSATKNNAILKDSILDESFNVKKLSYTSLEF